MKISDLVAGTPFDKLPPEPLNGATLAVDIRTRSLRALREYLCACHFWRIGANGPEPYRFPKTNVMIGWDDREMVFPSLVFVGTQAAEMSPSGMGSSYLEASRDVYGAGTVLVKMGYRTETFTIECWASSKPEARSMIAGLQYLLNPTEENRGLRLYLHDYYDTIVSFMYEDDQLSDDEAAVRGRFVGKVRVTMSSIVVTLVRYVDLEPVFAIDVNREAPEDAAAAIVRGNLRGLRDPACGE